MLNFRKKHRSLKSSSIAPMTKFPVQVSPVFWVKVPKNSQQLPENAFVACLMETGEHGYIARGRVDGQLVTGHTTASSGGIAFIPFGTLERRIDEFDILVAKAEDLFWVKESNGVTPAYAVAGGLDKEEQQYIGRTCTRLELAKTWQGFPLPTTSFDGERRVGKIHKSHRCLYVPFDGNEYIFRQYEVLRHKITPGDLRSVCRWNINKMFLNLGLDYSAFTKLPLPESLKQYLIKDLLIL